MLFLLQMIFAIVGTAFFLPSIILNIALALGAPWGAYAMNGKYKIIPLEIRKAFIIPIIMQWFAIFVLLSAGQLLPEIIPFLITRILSFFFALYFTFYTATLLFSVSRKERNVMGSFAVIATICFWIVAFKTLPITN